MAFLIPLQARLASDMTIIGGDDIRKWLGNSERFSGRGGVEGDFDLMGR